MKQLAVSQLHIIKRTKSTATTANMKKVKLDHRYADNHRAKQRSRPIAAFLSTMFKLENITILVLIVLAHQIHGIYSQGKKEPFFYFMSRKCYKSNVVTKLAHIVGLRCKMTKQTIWLCGFWFRNRSAFVDIFCKGPKATACIEKPTYSDNTMSNLWILGSRFRERVAPFST